MFLELEDDDENIDSYSDSGPLNYYIYC